MSIPNISQTLVFIGYYPRQIAYGAPVFAALVFAAQIAD
jgi:hypothetical protein